MKILILAAGHDVQVVSDEHEANRAKQVKNFDRVLNLDERASDEDSPDGHSNNVVAFPNNKNFDLNAQVDALEERLVRDAMATTGNNQVQAAKLLGVTRGALQYKLKKFASKIQQQAA